MCRCVSVDYRCTEKCKREVWLYVVVNQVVSFLSVLKSVWLERNKC